MVDRIVRLPTVEGLLFTFKDVVYSPEAPRMNEPFTVRGKIDLFRLPFFGPLWIIATAVYPETWWEEIIPIWGSPEVRADTTAIGSDFEITFPKGFEREGEFSLAVRAYAGPTMPLDSVTLPPFPPVASAETTFTVSGEAPPEEELFQNFRIVSYSKNGGTPVTPPGVLELDVGDRCRVNLAYNHKGPAVTGKFHAAIWHKGLIDPHDEILFKEQSFSVPSSADWEPYEKSIDITVTSAISPGTDYGLYCKIMGITGADVFTEFLENVITIVGVPAEGSIISKYINKAPEGSRIPLPTTVTADNNTFEVGVIAKNTSSAAFIGGIEVKVYDPDGTLRASPTIDWAGISPDEELRWEYNICRVDKAGPWSIEIRFLEKTTLAVLDEIETTMTATGEVPPELEPPEVETVDAENITHQSATIFGKLIDTSFWSRVKVFFAFGRTSQCENETQRYEMDEYDEGQQFQAELTGLDPGKRYYYKAAVDALGPRSEEVETNYGQTKSFTTEEEVVKGFTMRVINPPAGAAYWRAGCVAGGALPYMSLPEPLSYEWKWTKSVPDETLSFFVVASAEREDGWPTVQYDEFYFRLRNGKNYVWDFAAHEMREE